MLIGARDPRGTTNIYAFRSENENDLQLGGRDAWYSVKGILLSYDDDASKKACEGIKPGEWKEIDLAATDFVHLSPKKTAVQELVEASQNFRDGLFSDGGRRVGLTEFERRSHALESALARVRQEGGV